VTPFEFTSHGRNLRTAIVLIAVYAALVALVVVFDASLWLIAGLALTTLPALWDIWSNRSAGLNLTDDTLLWRSGKRFGSIALDDIERVRFDARWDFSVRVTVVPVSGKPVRLPYDALPPSDAFDTALKARSVRTERNPFSIL